MHSKNGSAGRTLTQGTGPGGNENTTGEAAYMDLAGAMEWLVRAEAEAGALYAKAVRLFDKDPKLAGLLEELSADEGEHLEMLVSAGNRVPPAALPVDFAVIDGISPIIAMFEEEVAAGTISEAGLMEMVVALEFSEHNELFAYVVNALRSFPEDMSRLFDSISRHRRRIRDYLGSKPELRGLLERLDSFQDFENRNKILVVDDEKTILSLIRIVMCGNAEIDAAENGEAALEALGSGDYSLVVSDVRMPVMDAAELYHRAAALRPGLEKKFLFLTGSIDGALKEFFDINGAEYMMKPLSIYRLKERICGILGQP